MDAQDRSTAGRGEGRRMDDRRNGINEVVRALAEHVVSGDSTVKLLAVFEHRLAGAMGADWVRAIRPGNVTAQPGPTAARRCGCCRTAPAP